MIRQPEALSLPNYRRGLLVLAIWALTFTLALAQSFRIGVVTDFQQSEHFDTILTAINKEIGRVVGSSQSVSMESADMVFECGDRSLASVAYQKLSSRTDVVLVIGAVSNLAALDCQPLSKPTFGLAITDPNLQRLPLVNERSGVQNYSYIWVNRDLAWELRQFAKLVDYSNLAILVDAGAADIIDMDKAMLIVDELSNDLKLNIVITPIGTDIAASLEAMPAETDAVFLSDLYGQSPENIAEIARILQAKKLPSFSGSKFHVDAGILGCMANENSLEQAIRRLAIMFDEAISGGDLAEMPVTVNQRRQFHLNFSTAKAIDFSPPFEVLFASKVIQRGEGQVPTHSLSSVIALSLKNNLDLRMGNKQIQLTQKDFQLAKNRYLPRLDLNMSVVQINEERSNAALGLAERTWSTDLSLNQLVFSEEALASIAISKMLANVQALNQEALTLEVLLDTYQGYFDVLSAKTKVLIQKENLDITHTNLKLARIRVDVGSASQAEVFRWESEVALATQASVEAHTAMISAKLALRALLAHGVEKDFDIEDVSIDGTLFQTFQDRPLSRYVSSPKRLQQVSDFLVHEALHVNPNKKQLLENMRVVHRQEKQNQRRFYLPTLAVQASFGEVLGRSGSGSDPLSMQGFEDSSWQAAVVMSYPLFQNGDRRVELQRTRVQLEQLELNERKLNNSIELSVRSGALSLLRANTNITFSKTASDNAHSNFELIQQSYERGAVTITQLIDAQNAALQAKLAHAISIYELMLAQIQLEYRVGSFLTLAPAEQQHDFLQRFHAFQSQSTQP